MRSFLIFFSFLLLAGIPRWVVAQEVAAHSVVDTNKIFIGKPVQLTIQLSQPKNLNIDWPLIIDSVGGMEIWKYTPPDTMQVEDENVLLRSQTFLITSYDSGSYIIPPVVFKYKPKGSETEISIETDPIRIDVFTVPVDTTMDIRDIRNVEEAPFDWKMIMWGVLAFHALLLVIALLVWALRKKSTVNDPVQKGDLFQTPPHLVALEALGQLEEDRVWQEGRVKEYYTRLTDILRTYMDGRWKLSTFELTSDEILSTSIVQQLELTQKEELERVLRLADLVKFAKWQAIPSENEWAMQLSRKFVTDTAGTETVTGDKVDNVMQEGGNV